MFIYDLQKDISEWVLMRGISTLLMSLELRSVNDLNNINPYLYNGQGLMEPHSPKLIHSIPTGEEESDTDSWIEPSDSGKEWDEAEHGDWSCCPTPPLGEEGPTWAEATAETPQRKIITDEKAPNWDEVTSNPPQKNVASDRKDSDWDDDTCAPTKLQLRR